MSRKILFLCTGNYYRSRFAEEIFNLRVTKLNLPFVADSAALALDRGKGNYGPISWYAIDGLESRGVKLREVIRQPKPVTIADLETAFMIIAMSHVEHHPIVNERHPDWLERIIFWEVADIDEVEPNMALGIIDREVDKLIDELKAL